MMVWEFGSETRRVLLEQVFRNVKVMGLASERVSFHSNLSGGVQIATT